MDPSVSVPILASWECLIGLGLLFGVFMRATLLLLAVQMARIIKNAVLISAAIVLGATAL